MSKQLRVRQRRINNVERLIDKIDEVWEQFDAGEVSSEDAKVHIGMAQTMLKAVSAKTVYNNINGVKSKVAFLEDSVSEDPARAPFSQELLQGLVG